MWWRGEGVGWRAAAWVAMYGDGWLGRSVCRCWDVSV